MAQFLQLLADPDRVGSRLHGHTRWRQVCEPLLHPFRSGSEAASTNDLSFLVKRAVVTPDIAKVDPDSHLDLALPAWDFRDEVLRWLLHGKQSLRSNPKDLLIPFIGRASIQPSSVGCHIIHPEPC